LSPTDVVLVRHATSVPPSATGPDEFTRPLTPDAARENRGRLVLVAGHGTFISRALAGFGVPVDWAFVRVMPMPAIYRVRFADPEGPAEPEPW
jgi:hypothetical protein